MLLFLIFAVVISLIIAISRLFKLKFSKRFYYSLSFIFLFLSIFFAFLGFFSKNISLKDSIDIESSDILFLLDISKSMDALDYGEMSRLQVAKEFIQNYVLSNPNNRYALNIFAGDTTSIVPFTSDLSLYTTLLDSVTTNMIINWWSNISEAINDSIDRFVDLDSWWLILLSDFEPTDLRWDYPNSLRDETILDLKDMGEKLREKNIYFYGVWVGDIRWNNIIDGYSRYFSTPIYVEQRWVPIITKLDILYLESVVKALDWGMHTLISNEDLNFQFDKILKSTRNLDEKIDTEFSRYVLIASFIFFMVYLFAYWRYLKNED